MAEGFPYDPNVAAAQRAVYAQNRLDHAPNTPPSVTAQRIIDNIPAPGGIPPIPPEELSPPTAESYPGRIRAGLTAVRGLARVLTEDGRNQRLVERQARLQKRDENVRWTGDRILYPKQTRREDEKYAWRGIHKVKILDPPVIPELHVLGYQGDLTHAGEWILEKPRYAEKVNTNRPTTKSELAAARRLDVFNKKRYLANREKIKLETELGEIAIKDKYSLSRAERRHMHKVSGRIKKLQKKADRKLDKFNTVKTSQDYRGRIAQFRHRRANRQLGLPASGTPTPPRTPVVRNPIFLGSPPMISHPVGTLFGSEDLSKPKDERTPNPSYDYSALVPDNFAEILHKKVTAPIEQIDPQYHELLDPRNVVQLDLEITEALKERARMENEAAGTTRLEDNDWQLLRRKTSKELKGNYMAEYLDGNVVAPVTIRLRLDAQLRAARNERKRKEAEAEAARIRREQEEAARASASAAPVVEQASSESEPGSKPTRRGTRGGTGRKVPSGDGGHSDDRGYL